MKNLFLLATFMLLGTFAFASNEVVNQVDSNLQTLQGNTPPPTCTYTTSTTVTYPNGDTVTIIKTTTGPCPEEVAPVSA